MLTLNCVCDLRCSPLKESSGEGVTRCRREPVLKGKIVEERQQSSQGVVSEIKVITVVTAPIASQVTRLGRYS